MKKEYIKPIIINIKIYNDDALCEMVSASLYNINEVDPIENIAGEGGEGGEDGPITGDDGYIWND